MLMLMFDNVNVNVVLFPTSLLRVWRGCLMRQQRDLHLIVGLFDTYMTYIFDTAVEYKSVFIMTNR